MFLIVSMMWDKKSEMALGLFLSFKLDIPTSPVIVASLACMFFIMLGIKVFSGIVKRNKPIDVPVT